MRPERRAGRIRQDRRPGPGCRLRAEHPAPSRGGGALPCASSLHWLQVGVQISQAALQAFPQPPCPALLPHSRSSVGIKVASSLGLPSWQTIIMGPSSRATQACLVPLCHPPHPLYPTSFPPFPTSLIRTSALLNPSVASPTRPQMPKGCARPHKATGCQATPGLSEDRPKLWSNYMGTRHLRSPRPGKAGSQVAATVGPSKAILFSKLQPRKSKQREGLRWRGNLGPSC